MTVAATTIGNECDILSGYAWRSSKFNRDGLGLPIIRIQNVDAVTDNEFVYWNEPYDDRFVIEKGDVLLTLSGSFRIECWDGPNGLLNQRIIKIMPKESVHTPWLLYALRNRLLQIEKMGRHALVNNVSVSDIRNLKIKLPPLDDQKRIAEVLDRAEALRARRRAALALLDELTQSIFLDMFGAPVTNPEGWPIRPIVELAENKDSMRVPIKQSDRDERSGKYPYYGSVGIIDDIDDFIYEGPHLLISEDGKHLETRNRPIACLADGQFWVNNHAHVLAANGNAELVFLAFNLEMRPLHQFVTGIDQFKLNRKSMDKIPVAVPPIELQQEFAQRIRAIEDQKSRFEAHLGELGSLFASLQSRAFKGELFGCSLEPVAAD